MPPLTATIRIEVVESAQVRAILSSALDVAAVAQDLEPESIPEPLRVVVSELRETFRLEALRPPRVKRTRRGA